MITAGIIIGVCIIIFGIYRMSKNHKSEGILEIIFGILEMVFEILGAFL